MVGVTEERGEDGGRGDLSESDAEGDRRGLDGRKICQTPKSVNNFFAQELQLVDDVLRSRASMR